MMTEQIEPRLARELDLRLAGPGCTQVRTLRLRFQGGAWEAPRDPLEPLHHVLDAPATPAFNSVRRCGVGIVSFLSIALPPCPQAMLLTACRRVKPR